MPKERGTAIAVEGYFVYKCIFAYLAHNIKRGDFMKNSEPKNKRNKENAVPEEIYPVIDSDLARDNLENDIPAVDLQDLDQKHLG